MMVWSDPLLQYKPWPIIQQINQFFEIQSIDSTSNVIPEDVEILLLVHPRVSDEQLMYAIDQFVMRGGRILAFLDPQNETAQMSPRQPPGAGSSDLKKLFEIRSAPSCRNSKPLLFSVPIFIIPILGLIFFSIIAKYE